MRNQDMTDENIPAKNLLKIQENFSKGKHMFVDLQCFPLCVVKMMLGGQIRQMLKPKYFTQNFIQSAIHYQSLMLKNLG